MVLSFPKIPCVVLETFSHNRHSCLQLAKDRANALSSGLCHQKMPFLLSEVAAQSSSAQRDHMRIPCLSQHSFENIPLAHANLILQSPTLPFEKSQSLMGVWAVQHKGLTGSLPVYLQFVPGKKQIPLRIFLLFIEDLGFLLL